VVTVDGAKGPIPVVVAPGGPPGQDKSISVAGPSKPRPKIKSVVVVPRTVWRQSLGPSVVSVAKSGRGVEVHPGLAVTIGGVEGEMPESIGSDVREQEWYQDYLDSIREVPDKFKDYCRECKSSLCKHCLP
jgi:hypothetical protein